MALMDVCTGSEVGGPDGSYREAGGLGLDTGDVVAQDGGLVKLTGSHQAAALCGQNPELRTTMRNWRDRREWPSAG